MTKSVLLWTVGSIFLWNIAPAFPCAAPGVDLPLGCSCEVNPYTIYCEIPTHDISVTLQALEDVLESTLYDRLRVRLLGPEHGVITYMTQRLRFTRMEFIGGSLSYIIPYAFSSTYNFTEELSFVAVKFSNIDPFSFFQRFKILKSLTIDGAQSGEVILDKIGNFAFRGMKSLQKIAVTSANVTEIGAWAFENLPYLEEINLRNNSLTNEGIAESAFSKMSPNVNTTLILDVNPGITQLEGKKFAAFLDAAHNKLSIDPPAYGVEDYHLSCDEKIRWICDKARDYEPKLEGYYCKDAATAYYNVFDYCNSSNVERPLTLISLLLIFGVISKLF